MDREETSMRKWSIFCQVESKLPLGSIQGQGWGPEAEIPIVNLEALRRHQRIGLLVELRDLCSEPRDEVVLHFCQDRLGIHAFLSLPVTVEG